MTHPEFNSAAIASVDPGYLATMAARFPESGYPDALARTATAGRFDLAELSEFALAGKRPAKDFDGRLIAWCAHVATTMADTDEEFVTAAALFDLAERTSGILAFSGSLASLRMQVFHALGDRRQTNRAMKHFAINPERVRGVELDRINPYATGDESNQARWWADFNRYFTGFQHVPVSLSADGPTPFDRLSGTAELDRSTLPLDPSAELALVSVIIPVYDPGPSFITAVRSLIEQSWTNLEILVCDDASPAESKPTFDQAAALDPRIKVIHAPSNGGAYAVRNLGLGLARGEFVAFNDADDWSHPQRIETQVRHLLAHRELLACQSRCVRVTKDLELNRLGASPIYPNLPSLIFRRQEVLSNLGGYDALRKASDTEFAERIAAVFGRGSIVELPDPLTLYQLTPGSLSRDDFRFGRTHPARKHYHAMLRGWHERIRRHESSPFLLPHRRAPFPAPRYHRGLTQTEPDTANVAVLANFSTDAPTAPDIEAEIDAMSSMGLSLALVENFAPHDLSRPVRIPGGSIAERLLDEQALLLLPGERAEVEHVIVRDPAAVEFMGSVGLSQLEVGQVVVVADYDFSRTGNPGQVDQLARQSGATEVLWWPTTPTIAAGLRDAGIAQVLEPAPWGVVPTAPAPVRLAKFPVVGTIVDADTPEIANWQELLGHSQALETRVLAAKEEFDRRFGTSRVRPRHISSRTTSLTQFVDGLDVLVVTAGTGRGAHTSRAALLALAQGKTVIMDSAFAEHFADAALYLDARNTADWLSWLKSDPARANRLRSKCAAAVNERWSVEAFTAGVTDAFHLHRAKGL